MSEANILFGETRMRPDLKWVKGANPFLAAVMRKLRSEDRPISTQEKKGKPTGMYFMPGQFDGKPYDWPAVYFETGGCSFDKAGACTMCNFGRGTNFTEEEVTSALTKQFAELKGKPGIVITPSGSLFDDKEVSPKLRREIYRLAKENGIEYFATESRAEFITSEIIGEMKELLGDVKIEVGLGLETIDPDVSRYSINKMLNLDIYKKAVDLLRAANIEVFTHVLLKPIFLSEKEAYEDALKTIQWAFAEDGGKTDRVGIGLMNLKPYTLAYLLGEHGMYKTPSYRTVVKLLQSLPEEMRNKVSLFGFNSGAKIKEETGGCPTCRDALKTYILKFVKTRDPKILDEAANYPCSSCKDNWDQEMTQEHTPFTHNLRERYEFIAQEVFGTQYSKQEQNKKLVDRSLPHLDSR
ncbi:MAG: radical SAM protein [Patescibacteria group bacterium]